MFTLGWLFVIVAVIAAIALLALSIRWFILG